MALIRQRDIYDSKNLQHGDRFQRPPVLFWGSEHPGCIYPLVIVLVKMIEEEFVSLKMKALSFSVA